MLRRVGYMLIFHLILSTSTVFTNESCIIKTTGETCTCPNASTNTSRPNKSPNEFTEGDDAQIIVKGDVAIGCSFSKKDESGKICCYKRKDRENEEVGCQTTQPAGCRAEDEYDIKEILKQAGKCKLTLYKSQTSDSGLYTVFFPWNNLKTEVNVTVKSARLEDWKITLIFFSCLIGSFLLCLLGAPIFYRFGKPWLEKREMALRSRDEMILKKLFSKCKCKDKKSHDEQIGSKKQCPFDIKGFRDHIGQRSILSLRDRNYNNIFHYAIYAIWDDQMTTVVLDTLGSGFNFKVCCGPATSDNVNDTRIPMLDLTNNGEDEENKRKNVLSKLIEHICPNVIKLNPDIQNFPQYLMPERLLRFNVSLNSKNLEGDTPLMIASNEGQNDVVEVLLAHQAALEITNKKGETALHKAVVNKQCLIVETLLRAGASQDTKNLQEETPLHTAVQINAFEIVKLLIPQLEGNERSLKNLWLDQSSKLKVKETPVQVAVRKGFIDIVKYLIEEIKDDSWKDDINSTFYSAIAGANNKIVDILKNKTEDFYASQWKDIGLFCLRKAVQETNQTAVYKVYNLMMSLNPSREHIKEALAKVKEMLGELNIEEQDKITDTITKLEKRLNTDHDNNQQFPSETKTQQDPRKAHTKKYIDFVKKLKRKNNTENIDEIEEDLEWFVSFQSDWASLGTSTSNPTSKRRQTTECVIDI